ncbi:TonB-dependent receptor [Dechloromonas sp. ARDL1]|uniref:TonB-dependent receptor n=1 Tax=Dechloromonas sp. ARDL1 TaxID=3322121 RepID=UPI003DA7053F
MACHVKLRLSTLAVLAAVGAPTAQADDQLLKPITVHEQAERADGPITGYRATRSATFTKTDTPLKEVPASVTVVPADLIKDQAMQSMADVLRYVPGASVHQGEGNRDQVVLRGNSTTADFFIDGIRDDAQIFRDLYNLERVEILKGPGGMAFGRGGAGGVVNRVTKKPVFGHVGEFALTLGSYNQRRTTLDVGEKVADGAAVRMNAMFEEAGSFRHDADLRRYAINPTLTLLLGPATSLTLSYEHVKDDRTADRGLPSQFGMPFQTDNARFFGNAEQSTARSTVDSFAATLEHNLGDGAQLRNSFRVTHYDKFYQNIYPGSAVSGSNTMSISAYNNSNDRSNIFNQTDLTTSFTTGGLQHTLLTGLEVGHQDSWNQRKTGYFGAAAGTIGSISATNPTATATRFDFRTTDANNYVSSDTAAVYVQDQISLSANWKVLAGLRYDYFKVGFDDRRTTTAQTDLQRTDKQISPRLGLIWSPTRWSTYYASYSYAFLPSGEQLGLATSTADLAPEKSTNYELGARWDLMPRLSMSLGAFQLDKDDVRSKDPSGSGRFVKTGQQRTTGVEIGLQGDVTRNWQVYAGYANLNARVTKALSTGTDAGADAIPVGRKIGLVPENMFSLWNRINLSEQWGAGLGIIHQSSSYASISNSVKLPGFTRVDGALYYTVKELKSRLALNVENLFDKNYYPTADGDNNISPGAPRTVRLTMNTSF